jgi:hypothetical protein
MKITYENSTSTTTESATAISGVFNDQQLDSGPGPNKGNPISLGYRPHVNVYLDTVFGSYMFQDPDAPRPCCKTVDYNVNHPLDNVPQR